MILYKHLVGCRLKANSPLMAPGTIEGVPSLGFFLSLKHLEITILKTLTDVLTQKF